VHSADGPPAMRLLFLIIDQRLALWGFGVPDLAIATACALERATVIVEDEMPNAVFEPVPDAPDQTRKTRRIKFFRFPIPDDVLLSADGEVELRITLSYFGEPITTRRRKRLGLELWFDVQGPDEDEDQFRERMNNVLRDASRMARTQNASESERDQPNVGESAAGDDAETPQARRSRGFTRYWELGVLRRSRGSIQSDRLTCPAALLAGSKLIAVVPKLGWWDERDDTVEESMRFSLIATVTAPGRDVYTPIQQALELAITPQVEPTSDIQIES
jgi:hypothetical protein